MLRELFLERIEFTLALWAILYFSDYYLTIWAARLYRSSASSHIRIEGSLEITPYFREDIDSTRLVSTRFLRVLLLSLLLLGLAWILLVRTFHGSSFFEAIVGGLILLEATAHLRHIRNVAFMRRVRDDRGLEGMIQYPRWLSLEISAVELFGYAFLFLTIAVLIRIWFFAGGAATCFVTGLGHLIWSRKAHANGANVRLEGLANEGEPAPTKIGGE